MLELINTLPAGQTIFHAHIHLIPWRDGDTNNPKGGVRGVIDLSIQHKDLLLDLIVFDSMCLLVCR